MSPDAARDDTSECSDTLRQARVSRSLPREKNRTIALTSEEWDRHRKEGGGVTGFSHAAGARSPRSPRSPGGVRSPPRAAGRRGWEDHRRCNRNARAVPPLSPMTQAVRGEGGVRAYSFDIGRPDQIEVDPEVRKRLTGTTTTNTSSSPVELGDSEAIGLLRSDSMDDRVSLRYSEEEGGGDVEQGFLVAGDRETAAWRRWREECDRAFKL